MVLSQENGDLYYRLWIPLLDFTNKTYHVNKRLKNIPAPGGMDPEDVQIVAEKLWTSKGIIDQYLKKHPELSEEDKEIIRSWKHCIRGRFIVERHLKKGSILISTADEKVYQVLGIRSSLEEMFGWEQPPFMVETTLLPFCGKIISDGLAVRYNVVFGSGWKRTFKNVYMSAKQNGQICCSL